VICYASHTHNKRNLAALRTAGWGLMISRARPDGKPEGMRYALDNGAWTDFRNGTDFDDDAFRRLVDRLGGAADFVISPDIVAGGQRSLRLSLVWLAPLLVRTKLVLVPVQDGMGPADLVDVVIPNRVGIFLGGSTDWKLATMRQWGEFCAERGAYFHVGRVNTLRRFRLAHQTGADSVDGSSASRYSVTVGPLDFAARQPDMWAPPRAWPDYSPPINRDEQYEWAGIPEPEVAREAPRLREWRPFTKPAKPVP
jgi:hypothetical protein